MTGHLQEAASVGGIVSAARRVVNHYSTKIGDLCVRALRLLRRVSDVGRGAGILVATSCHSAEGGVIRVFERIVNQANDAIIVAELDPNRDGGFKIIYANEAFERIFGYAKDEVIGRSPRMLQGPGTSAATIREISGSVHRGEPIRRRILNYGRNGQQVWIDINIVPLPQEGGVQRFAAIERDITLEVGHEDYLKELAFADPLTKLGNRRFFDQTLLREMPRARRSGQPLSLVTLDIDHFKAVNDTWGHPVGDQVLVAVARAIEKALRAYDHVARVGGEEFMVLLPGACLKDAATVIGRVCDSIREQARVTVGDQIIAVTCSAGLTCLAHPSETAETLTERADRALYMAKSAGRNRVVTLDPELEPLAETVGAA